ncbi:MAG: hypothetical protein GQ558_04110 [Thermoplasmata archaeon]|nr:hypothetical protein [Thermoplasmata archaeon]
MDPLPYWAIAIALIVTSLAIAILMDIRKRREVMDLLPGEAKAIKDLQENAKWPKEMIGVRPAGKPLYSDGFLGHIRIYRNGVKAKFAIIDTISLLRSTTGYQKRHVVRYRTSFYPYAMIAAMYPIKIGIIRKVGRGRTYTESSDGRFMFIGSSINALWALGDDHTSMGWPIMPTDSPNIVTAIQVETKDFRTAILCPEISSGGCEVQSVVKALGKALGPGARQLVRLEFQLGGGYYIYEEPGYYDHEHRRQYRGDRSRIMLGDLHKHYILRSQPGYAERRKQANRVMLMADISMLDDYLRTA